MVALLAPAIQVFMTRTAPLALASPGPGPSWAYRKQITIDNANVENENFTNFPVLISLAPDAGLAAAVVPRAWVRKGGVDVGGNR